MNKIIAIIQSVRVIFSILFILAGGIAFEFGNGGVGFSLYLCAVIVFVSLSDKGQLAASVKKVFDALDNDGDLPPGM